MLIQIRTDSKVVHKLYANLRRGTKIKFAESAFLHYAKLLLEQEPTLADLLFKDSNAVRKLLKKIDTDESILLNSIENRQDNKENEELEQIEQNTEDYLEESNNTQENDKTNEIKQIKNNTITLEQFTKKKDIRF